MFFIKIPGVIDTKKLVCVAVRLGAMPCPARRCPLFFPNDLTAKRRPPNVV
jgi:hypothetical protein